MKINKTSDLIISPNIDCLPLLEWCILPSLHPTIVELKSVVVNVLEMYITPSLNHVLFS